LELYWKQNEQKEAADSTVPGSPLLSFSSGFDSRKRKRTLSTA
jgi:hypothetical protein